MRVLEGASFRQGKYWGFWFRLFGYGLAVSNMQPLFSERNGFRKTIRVSGIKTEILTPPKTESANGQ